MRKEGSTLEKAFILGACRIQFAGGETLSFSLVFEWRVSITESNAVLHDYMMGYLSTHNLGKLEAGNVERWITQRKRIGAGAIVPRNFMEYYTVLGNFVKTIKYFKRNLSSKY